MTLEADILPLHTDDTGTIRVADTRLTLDVLLAFYLQGQTAEQLHEGFPVISLADIHSVIGYYLRHQESVDQYLKARQIEASNLRDEIESQYPPEFKASIEALKARRSSQPKAP